MSYEELQKQFKEIENSLTELQHNPKKLAERTDVYKHIANIIVQRKRKGE